MTSCSVAVGFAAETAFVNSQSFELGAIILAAGRSSRMGRPKLLLPWDQTSILGHLINIWRQLGATQISVVCAADDSNMRVELDRLTFPREHIIENSNPENGMFSSLLCAAAWKRWNPSITHWAIILGDQPHIRIPTLQQLINWARAHPEQICQPVFAGKSRHPVVLPKSIFLELANSGASDLREFLQNYQIAGCGCDDPGLVLDIDLPEDYQKALGIAGPTSS